MKNTSQYHQFNARTTEQFSQMVLRFVNIVKLEHIRMSNQLHDGDLAFQLVSAALSRLACSCSRCLFAVSADLLAVVLGNDFDCNAVSSFFVHAKFDFAWIG